MKKRLLKINWDRLYPMGYDHHAERNIFHAALFGASFWAVVGFINRYLNWLHSLERPARQLLDFYEILAEAFFWFPIILVLMLAAVFMHYAYHRAGSKSIYLMRRLPSRWELHRRCIAGSAICAAVALAVAIILFWIFYASYLLFTPKIYLTGDQLTKFFLYWRVM